MMAYEKIEEKKKKKKCLAIRADALHQHKLLITQVLGHIQTVSRQEAQTQQKQPHVRFGHEHTSEGCMHVCGVSFKKIVFKSGHKLNTVTTRLTKKKKKPSAILSFLNVRLVTQQSNCILSTIIYYGLVLTFNHS